MHGILITNHATRGAKSTREGLRTMSNSTERIEASRARVKTHSERLGQKGYNARFWSLFAARRYCLGKSSGIWAPLFHALTRRKQRQSEGLEQERLVIGLRSFVDHTLLAGR